MACHSTYVDIILVDVDKNLVVLFVGVLALITFGFDPLPLGVTCLIRTGVGVLLRPSKTQAHISVPILH
jgi:hypothetical protein